MKNKLITGCVLIFTAAAISVIITAICFSVGNKTSAEPQSAAEESSVFVSEEESSSRMSALQEVYNQNILACENPLHLNKDSVRLYISADNNDETMQNTLNEIKRISDEICIGTECDSDRLFAISQWVSENIYYDYDARNGAADENTYTLAHILETRRTICFGYANLVAALCSAQGIDCRVAHGTASFELFAAGTKTQPHEWNIAVINGEYIWLDALWDTTNGYINGKYEEGSISSDNFDMPPEELCRTRRAERIDIRDYFSCLD